MEDVIKEKDLIGVINNLIESGVQIRVFGLNYEPYYEDVTITDEKVNRSGFVLTTSGIALDLRTVISKMKVRTFTGFSRLFTKVNGVDEYKINLVMNNRWVSISIQDYESIAPGMILAIDDTSGKRNLGMILDVLEPEESKGKYPHSIMVSTVNTLLQDIIYEINLDANVPGECIFDRVLKLNK